MKINVKIADERQVKYLKYFLKSLSKVKD